MKDPTGYTYKLPKIPLKKLNPKQLSTLEARTSFSIPTDESRHDPSLDFLVAKTRLKKSNEALILKRSKCEKYHEKLDIQWSRLEHYENAFRDTVIAHNKFLRDNLEKRTRAIAKSDQSHLLIETRQNNIDKLSQEVSNLRFISNEMRREIGKLEIYDSFLSTTVKDSESPFRTINELLNKFESLECVREGRMVQQKKESTKIMRLHKGLFDMFHDKNFIVVGLRNDVNALCCKYDEISRRNLASEALIRNICNKANDISFEVNSCQYMIDAIYRYICQRRKIPPDVLTITEITPKIDVIKSTLGGWETVLTTEQQLKKKTKRARHASFIRPKDEFLFLEKRHEISKFLPEEKKQKYLKKNPACLTTSLLLKDSDVIRGIRDMNRPIKSEEELK